MDYPIRSREAVVPASMLHICRQQGIPALVKSLGLIRDKSETTISGGIVTGALTWLSLG